MDGTADRWFRLPFTLAAGQADAVARLLAQAWEHSSLPTTRDPRAPRWTA